MKVIKVGSKKLGLLKINDDSFAYNLPLGIIFYEFNRLSGMDDDLFTYEVKIPGVPNIPCDKKEGDDSDNVRSYKKQFNEYMEIKKQWVTHGIDADIEYDPYDVEFAEWLASKFYNHKTMDRYTKNALWIYWTRGDDEVELTDEEFSDPDNKNLIDKDEVAKIFRIETDIFDFETLVCKAFNEFNYLLKIDTNLLTSDILRFKTYDEFKNEWMNEWNKRIPWVLEEPWSENGIPIDGIHHIYGKLKEEALKQKSIYKGSWGDATQGVMNFCTWLKRCFRNFHELYYEILVKLEECWWKMNDHECSPFTNWRNHIHKTYANTNINNNYNPYLDVSRTFNHDARRNDDEAIHKERKSNNEHNIRNFDCDLVRDNARYHSNEEEEQYEEDRCKMLGNPCQKPPVCKIRRFEVIKYSFGPAEKYIAIKECEYEDLTRIEEDACHAYQEIFRIMDEGWCPTKDHLTSFDMIYIRWPVQFVKYPTRCHILSPVKELCPQSLRRSIRRRFRISKKAWVLFFAYLDNRTSPRVPTYLDNQNTTLFQTLDLTVHDLDRFFNEVEFVVDLDFIQQYSKSFVRHAFLQVRDVKSTVNSA
ncbi:hypothetical protein Tco_0824247 [Tanacetum coccineum]|uniref:Uncharacterized protein n=1 Tax=Tanacetum coccineum TaxID=301880 RepID=A0ABQ5APK3_9ASTR